MRKTTILVMVLILIFSSLISGCATANIADINENPDKYMGKKVIVKGEAVAPIDFGKMKGFTLKADETTILVSTDKVPERGKEVTVRGTVVKGILMGHYIFADKVAVK